MPDYSLLISMIKNSLKEGKVIEAYEGLRELEKVHQKDIEKSEKRYKKRRGDK